MPTQTVRCDRSGPVARVVLARPAVHNAFNEGMIAEIGDLFAVLAADRNVRVVVLAAEGKSFSAGADIEWMKRQALADPADNRADAERMAAMLRAIDELPRPVVARVHGAALGGGTGLVAVSDIVLATRNAILGTTEVRVGLLPSVIGPFVVRKIGFSRAREHFLRGDRFDAETACRMGLVHEVLADEAELDVRLDAVVAELLAGSPAAQAESKLLLRALAQDPTDEGQRRLTVETIARVRASAEGREGLQAFLEKRKPAWHPQ